MHLSLDDHLEHTCPNCGKDHEAKFSSVFMHHAHYVRGNCTHCNYEIMLRHDQLGMGLFLPDGSSTAVKETFRSKHLDHLREELKETVFDKTHTNVQMKLHEEKKKEEKK